MWPDSRRFKSHSEWEPIGFFSEGLCNATTFDLKLGFFSSSAINVLCDGFACFLYNGGRMRLIINDILSEQDKKAITNGLSTKELPAFNIKDIEGLKNALSERDKHFFDCLEAFGIAKSVMEPTGTEHQKHPKTMWFGIFAIALEFG